MNIRPTGLVILTFNAWLSGVTMVLNDITPGMEGWLALSFVQAAVVLAWVIFYCVNYKEPR